MEEYIREGERLKRQFDVITWGRKMKETNLVYLRHDFRHIQVNFASILNKYGIDHNVFFNGGEPTGQEEIQTRIKQQGLDANGLVSIADPVKKHVKDGREVCMLEHTWYRYLGCPLLLRELIHSMQDSRTVECKMGKRRNTCDMCHIRRAKGAGCAEEPIRGSGQT